MKDFKISIPEGYEIDECESTFEHIVFKEVKQPLLPLTWEELVSIKGAYIASHTSTVESTELLSLRTHSPNKNVFPTVKLAQAVLALAQLLQLRDRYNDGWVADWADSKYSKYIINIFNNRLTKVDYYETQFVMAFKTEELRDQFFNNFQDLLETAKPLL